MLALVLYSGHLLGMFVVVRECAIHIRDIQIITVSEGSRTQAQPLDLLVDEENADTSSFDPGAPPRTSVVLTILELSWKAITLNYPPYLFE